MANTTITLEGMQPSEVRDAVRNTIRMAIHHESVSDCDNILGIDLMFMILEQLDSQCDQSKSA